MVLRRIGVLSLAKVLAVIYAGIGLVVGGMLSMFAVLGGIAGASRDAASGVVGLLIGVGAIFFAPIFYGVMGFLGGLLTAALYNGASSLMGGLELDLDPGTGS